jgi:SAM-dependent methyltransferase
MAITDDFSKALDRVLADVPNQRAFLELSLDRERAYLQRSIIRWQEVLELTNDAFPLGPDISVLDVGVSPFTFALKHLFLNTDALDLTDYFKDRCETAGIRLEPGGVEQVHQLPVAHYDVVFFLEVLEHLHLNPVCVLRGLCDRLKPGGICVVSTPNIACLGNRLRFMFNRKIDGVTYPSFAENEHLIHGHQHDRLYFSSELAEYMALAGFSEVRVHFQAKFPANLYGFPSGIKQGLANLARLAIPSLRLITVAIGRT